MWRLKRIKQGLNKIDKGIFSAVFKVSYENLDFSIFVHQVMSLRHLAHILICLNQLVSTMKNVKSNGFTEFKQLHNKLSLSSEHILCM